MHGPGTDGMAKIQSFGWRLIEALATTAGVCLLALAHKLLTVTLAYALQGEAWQHLHLWTEIITGVVFTAVYFFLLLEVVELFWPRWLTPGWWRR